MQDMASKLLEKIQIDFYKFDTSKSDCNINSGTELCNVKIFIIVNAFFFSFRLNDIILM